MNRNRVILRGWIACAVILTLGVMAEAGTVRRVDLNATGTPIDGSTWPRAYRDFASAISASSAGDEVWVGQGTYFAHASNTAVSFNLKSGVMHKGGFAGVTETNPDDNDPVAYPTILSGDIDQDDGAGCAVDDAGNSEHVVTAGAVSNSTILEGFVITHGNAGFGDGGGLQVTSTIAFLHVANCKFTCNRGWNGGAVDHGGSRSDYFGCTFENNVAGSEGGAIFANGGELTITECGFLANSAGTGGALAIFNADQVRITGCGFSWHQDAVYGGAIFNSGSTNTDVINCDFQTNITLASGGAVYQDLGENFALTGSNFEGNTSERGHGGAVFCIGVDAAIRDCSFSSNFAPEFSGGAVHAEASSPIVINCHFVDNEALVGGAMYSSSPELNVVNSSYFHNIASNGGAVLFENGTLDVLNSLFAKNEADEGGAVHSSGTTMNLVNCTVTDNDASSFYGGLYSLGNATIRNCIVWGNTAASGTTLGQQITVGAFATLAATYSDVQGGVLSGTGNKSVDPWFIDSGLYNYRLRLCSQCLDSCDYDAIDDDTYDVDNYAPNNGDATPDLDLHLRAVDRANIANTGVGEFTFTDMGAFENCVGDANGDRKINGLDIQPFVNCLLESAAEADVCDCADSTLDGELTLDDVPCFVSVLLGVTDGCYTCAAGGLARGIADCNENEVPDANDIAEGTSQDCNGNFIPDECDIGSETSVDIDGNGVPDECQPDCNGNNIPDVWDIDPEDPDGDEEVSADCNENGVPDECERDCNENGVPDDCDINVEDPDGDEWVSPDCNANGVPDECEFDCNENGVPDDCDLDPEDPDGDEWVSPDCNANGLPDECDMTLPAPFTSYDCNENEIPDECDIADETSCDANENGVPDECDILLESCEDTNEDDCCDEESFMGGGEGGGESMMSGESFTGETPVPQFSGPCAELSEAECWSGFYDWAFEQCWGPGCEFTGFEQYQSAQAKLAELGLP